MASQLRRILRKVAFNVNFYISLGLAILLIPTAMSGAALVWRDQVDRALNPGRYAITGTQISLPPSSYLASALAAVGEDHRLVDLRYPQEPGWPLLVTTRTVSKDGKASGASTVFVDPPTGRVLGVVGISASFVGIVHNFHHMLSLPQFSGRQIVGWIGVAMLIIALSGIFIWWPRNNNFRAALRWKRTPNITSNLHHLIGFWISIPLAIVSITGIYLSFPRTAYAFMTSMVPVSAPMQHGYGAIPIIKTGLDADRVLALALTSSPEARPLSISLPITQHTTHAGPHGHDMENEQAVWIVKLHLPRKNGETAVTIDGNSGEILILPPALAGDRAVDWITGIHEGRKGGAIWAILAFLSGILPLILLITGVAMWTRQPTMPSSKAERQVPGGVPEREMVSKYR